MVPAGLRDAEWAAHPDQPPWAEVRLGLAGWGAWAGARRASVEAWPPGRRGAGVGKSADPARDDRAPGARQWDGPAWDDLALGGPAGLHSPKGSPRVREAQALYKRDAGRFAAQSRAAAELWAQAGVEAERWPRPGVALALAVVGVEEPALRRAARLARVELARQGELAE